MKKLLFLLILFFLNISAINEFRFGPNKNGDGLDPNFIKKIVETFEADIFFETGTYNGDTTMNAIPYFKKTYTVELHIRMFNNAKNRFSSYKNVYVYNGSSPEVIKKVAPTIDGNILFWLDAHYCGRGTAHSGNSFPNYFDDPKTPSAMTPIREELLAIKEADIKNCTILIDDIRGFGSEISGQIYMGCWAYPTVQEIKNYLLNINPNFEIIILEDTLLAYDKNKYNPEFSETIKACTKSLFYDGYNLTDKELLEVEEKIINAPLNEKLMISLYYNRTINDIYTAFWRDLWYGLIQLGSKNYFEAKKAFSKIKNRYQEFGSNGQFINKTAYYDHWRIDKYLGLCD